MPERWLGVTVSSDTVIVVDAEVPSSGALVIQGDHTWSLQQGDRISAYRVMHQHLADYANENRIRRAVIKGSALSRGGTGMAHIHAAELRGVVMCALSLVENAECATKAQTSRTFGERKVDEYLRDDNFWSNEIAATTRLRAGSREAALLLLAARDKHGTT